MSTDLHIHHQLPKLRISSADQIPDHVHAMSSTVIAPPEIKIKSEIQIQIEIEKEDENESQSESEAVVGAVVADGENEESYRTPTSKESKIPEIMTCPPAPKKPKPFVSCKRKLMDEFQFFEVSNNEDMDAFFRSTFPKRTCPCT
uniref:Cyclin-dependent protein kinase inhibitor SMR2 n=1 Tax=Cicer arietinum TaxID=3827 RepID=A0A1S2XXP8_CICAR|nr:cyclin-dependent protein kinase inhibitor SMR2 [Cicer arietinum]